MENDRFDDDLDENSKIENVRSMMLSFSDQLAEIAYSTYFNDSRGGLLRLEISFRECWEVVSKRSINWHAYARIASWAVGMRWLQQYFMKWELESKEDQSWLHFGVDRPSVIDPLEECYIEFPSVESSDQDVHEIVCSQQFLRLALGNCLLVAGESVDGLNMIREMVQVNVPTTSPYRALLNSLATNAITQLLEVGDSPDLESSDLLELLSTTQEDRFASNAENIVVDRIATNLERNPNPEEYEVEIDRWIALLDSVSGFKNNTSSTTAYNERPDLAASYSDVRWAWLFGQISGRLVCSMTQIQSSADSGRERLEKSLFSRLEYQNDFDDSSYLRVSLLTLIALLDSYNPDKFWEESRQGYLQIWNLLGGSNLISGDSLSSSLAEFWATKVGFADGCLALSNRIPAPSTSVDQGNAMFQEVLNRLELESIRGLKRQVDLEHKLEEMATSITGKLPPSVQEIKVSLRTALGEVWDELNIGVKRALIKAERFHLTGIDEEDSKLWFAKAIEGLIRHRFVLPFIGFHNQQGYSRFQFYLREKPENYSANQVQNMSLADWGEIWESKQLLRYVGLNFDLGAIEELADLSADLKKVQALRNLSAHYQTSRGTTEEESSGIRDIALGIGTNSLLERIVNILP